MPSQSRTGTMAPWLTGEMQLIYELQQAIPEAELSELAPLLGLGVVAHEPHLREIVDADIAGNRPPLRDTIPAKIADIAPVAYPPARKTHPFPFLYSRTSKQPVNGVDPPAILPFHGHVTSDVGEERYPGLLTAWCDIWPFLLTLFREQYRSKRLDTAKIIDHAVKQKPFVRVPWQTMRRWPGEIVLVVDNSRHLRPYSADYRHLAEHLLHWFKRRIKLIICADAEQQIFLYEGQRYEEFPVTPGQLHILYLGDLGFLDRQGISPWRWLEFGRCIHARGGRIEALLTAHPVDWRSEHARFFRIHHWEKGGLQAGGRGGKRSRIALGAATGQEQVETLLSCLSLAFELTPALVRYVRLRLGLSISTESLIFQHSALHGNFYCFQWHSKEIRETYRQKLQAIMPDPAQQQEIWQLIAQFEDRLPVELRIEQRQLAGKQLAEEQENFVGRVIRSLEKHTLDSKEEQAILHWVGRMSARAGEEPWSEATSKLYAFYHRAYQPELIPPGVDASCLSASLEQQSHSTVALFQEQDHLLCTTQPDSYPLCRMLGQCEVDDLAVVEVLNPHGTKKYPVPINGTVLLPIQVQEAHIHTRFEKLTLRFSPCPKWAAAIGRDRYGLFAEVVVRAVAFRLRWIPPGSFLMGSPEDEPERFADEGPRHRVDFSLGFWLAETACSQALWTAVMGKNPSRFTDDLENPVENVRWEMAAELIENINSRVPGLSLRLPSEAEWEYACRAGTTTPFSFGDSLTPGDANYNGTFPYGKGKKGEYRGRTMPVKSFRPNPWGLYQMHGNVWEWCQDIWHDNYTGAPANGRAWLEGGDNERRVCRGGSWGDRGRYLRSAYRGTWFNDNDSVGLRLARGPEEQEIKERSR